MLDLEDLVCDAEQSRVLNKLGIDQSGLFFWWHVGDGKYTVTSTLEGNVEPARGVHRAFTASELAYHYPPEVWITVRETSFKRKKAFFYFIYQDGLYKIALMVQNGSDIFEVYRVEHKHEAKARAKMLIYLYENSMMQPNT